MQPVSKVSTSQGFSLVEVLICITILGVMSIGFASMMSSANSANRNVTMTLEANSTTSMLDLLLSDRKFCEINFTVNNVVDIDLDQLTALVIPINKFAYPVLAGGAPEPEVLFDRAKPKAQGSSVKIVDMFLSNFRSLNSAVQLAKLNIVYDKGPGTQGPPLITRGLYLRLETIGVLGTVVRVLHCNSLGNNPPIESAPAGGAQTPTDQQEIDDKLFQNLVAGMRSTVHDKDKIKLIVDMITAWQKFGLVSNGRYMTVAKFGALFKDGKMIRTQILDSADICSFFSGKIIDIDKVPLAVKSLRMPMDAPRCTKALAM